MLNIKGQREWLYKGRRLSESFYEKLSSVDRYCDAILDIDHEGEVPEGLFLPASALPVGAIHVFSERKAGVLVHEITVKRRAGECNSDLEARTIERLHETDIWRRFGGDAKAYEDYLEAESRKMAEADKKEKHDQRVGELLDNHGDAIAGFVKAVKQKAGTGLKHLKKETIK